MVTRMLMLSVALVFVPIGGVLAEPNCSCMANGQSYKLGEIACFNLPGGQKRARCDRVLNNTSWTFLDGGCPSANAESETQMALLCPRPDRIQPSNKDRPLKASVIRTTKG